MDGWLWVKPWWLYLHNHLRIASQQIKGRYNYWSHFAVWQNWHLVKVNILAKFTQLISGAVMSPCRCGSQAEQRESIQWNWLLRGIRWWVSPSVVRLQLILLQVFFYFLCCCYCYLLTSPGRFFFKIIYVFIFRKRVEVRKGRKKGGRRRERVR